MIRQLVYNIKKMLDTILIEYEESNNMIGIEHVDKLIKMVHSFTEKLNIKFKKAQDYDVQKFDLDTVKCKIGDLSEIDSELKEVLLELIVTYVKDNSDNDILGMRVREMFK